jgi:hypothetical protein
MDVITAFIHMSLWRSCGGAEAFRHHVGGVVAREYVNNPSHENFLPFHVKGENKDRFSL